MATLTAIIDARQARSGARDFQAATKRMGRAANDAGKKVGRLQGSFARLRKSLTGMKGLIAGAFAGIALRSIAREAAGFETNMARIVGLVGVAKTEVDRMGLALRKMAKEVGKGPKDLAKALFFVTSAGARGSKAISIVRQSAKAAAAGLGDTTVVANALTTALNAYAASGLTAAKATGILVASVREGKLEAETLAPALGTVVSVAKSMGVTFDQVGASLAAVSRVGLEPALAATTLNATLLSFAKPVEQQIQLLAELQANVAGVAFTYEDLRRQIREEGLLSALRRLQNLVGDNDTAMTKLFPNIRAFRFVMALLGQEAESVNKIFRSLAKESGQSLDFAFSSIAETIEFKFNVAMAELKDIMIDIGSNVLPPIVDLLGKIRENLNIILPALGALAGAKLAPGGPIGKVIGAGAGAFLGLTLSPADRKKEIDEQIAAIKKLEAILEGQRLKGRETSPFLPSQQRLVGIAEDKIGLIRRLDINEALKRLRASRRKLELSLQTAAFPAGLEGIPPAQVSAGIDIAEKQRGLPPLTKAERGAAKNLVIAPP